MRRVAVLLAILAAALAAAAASAEVPAGGPGARHCGAFATQAEAEEYFVGAGGGPTHDVGRTDRDHDGVACEGLGGAYAGYATIGYNRRGQFFYGTATMPPGDEAGDEVPCLAGNSHYPMGPRRLRVYRDTPDGPKRVFNRTISAEARPDSGRLLWKAPMRSPMHGSYFAEFEERVRLSPNGRNECPAFSSRPTNLPAVPMTTRGNG